MQAFQRGQPAALLVALLVALLPAAVAAEDGTDVAVELPESQREIVAQVKKFRSDVDAAEAALNRVQAVTDEEADAALSAFVDAVNGSLRALAPNGPVVDALERAKVEMMVQKSWCARQDPEHLPARDACIVSTEDVVRRYDQALADVEAGRRTAQRTLADHRKRQHQARMLASIRDAEGAVEMIEQALAGLREISDSIDSLATAELPALDITN